MALPISPKKIAQRLARLLRPERPDYAYLKKAFQHTRTLLGVKPTKAKKRLPQLLTDQELIAFYEAVWKARNPKHMVSCFQPVSGVNCSSIRKDCKITGQFFS